MNKDKRLFLFPKYTDKLLIISTFILIIYGSIMIVSASMGEQAGDSSIITSVGIRQVLYFVIGIIGMTFFANFRIVSLRSSILKAFYFIILGLLLITRAFGSVNGAYAWIKIGSLGTVQPSEFAKVFIIVYAAKNLGVNCGENNIKNLKRFWLLSAIYFAIIAFYQKDLGSAVVLLGICYIITLIPPYKEFNAYHFYAVLAMFGVIALAIFLLSPIGTSLLEHFSLSYQVARFLASANPFAYQYDSGYHLIMGLVSFATGGWFGKGYGNSIHKYMNFPNPSTDFILPVIVEEMGIIFGLLFIVGLYGIILFKLIRYSIKTKNISSKIVLIGTYSYLVIHFVLNVGGVSGLIPLTGVPLLFVSSGGSSLVSAMACIGICESEIVKYRKDKDESNSR